MTRTRLLVLLALGALSCARPVSRVDAGSEARPAPVKATARAPNDVKAAPAPIPAQPRAFSGALGWAAATPGGRGGKLLRVTSLAAEGPGTLAEALAYRGPRIIVFEVGGVIDLERKSLKLVEPFVTIAGQTAPSPGITIIRGGLHIKTHDVIVQHLRVRPGEAGQPKRSGWEVDGISTSAAEDVIVDHCSTSWATDENLSASGPRFQGSTADEWRAGTSRRVTFSNNIVAEGLSHSTHEKGEHSKGSLIHDNVTEVLIVNSLYHSNVERNPFFKGGARGVVANNVISNPKQYAVKYTLVPAEWGEHEYQTGQMAVVGNVFRHGPDTPPSTPLLYSSGGGQCEIFVSDNLIQGHGAGAALLGGTLGNWVEMARPPLWPPGFEALPARAVLEHVTKHAGARPWDRDAVDLRIVQEALSRGGKVVDSEVDVEGYPELRETRQTFTEAEWDLETMERR